MRADRLISLLMLLQVNGKMTARQLSQELEVSERTIYRDIDALSTSGVPVYAEAGREGGYALLDSYRTSLTGLNESEARALFMLSVPAPVARLGLSQELRRALLKLTAALPGLQQRYEEQVRQRFYLDSSWWKQEDEPVPHLQAIYQAVWEDYKLFLTYRPVPHVKVSYIVEPYALVAKAGSWHLVAAHESKLQVYRVAELIDIQKLDEKFTRRSGFDLEGFWKDWCERQNRSRLAYPVQVRVSAGTLDILPLLFGEEVRQRIAQAGQPDLDGWFQLELCFANLETARLRLLPLGGGVEIVSPQALRRSIEDYAEQILKVYRGEQ